MRDLRADPDVGALVLYCRDVTARAPAPGVDAELLELSLTDAVTGLPNRAALVRRLGDGPARGRRPPVRPRPHRHQRPRRRRPRPRRTEAASLPAYLPADPRASAARTGWPAARTATSPSSSTAASPTPRCSPPASSPPSDRSPIPGGTLHLTANAGVTALAADVDPGEALRRGDLALRSARTAGPSAVHRYDDALRIEQDRRAALRADLDGALDRGELRLVFQPVVDVVMHRTVSVEALLRWRHPVFGEVSPTEFVPLAEESPLITDMGRWVLREACTTIAALDDADLAVAVNVSARQVRSGELVPDVLGALEASGLPASRLIVEITESVLLDDSHVLEDLTVLRQLGVRIAIDDFGTGWSSLAYLVGMPVDVLKMDQYFLANVEHDPARRAMCRAVLHLGASLGLPVIVEGVTNPAVLTLLRDMGHRYLQGYVLSRPLELAQRPGSGPTSSSRPARASGAVPTARVPSDGARRPPSGRWCRDDGAPRPRAPLGALDRAPGPARAARHGPVQRARRHGHAVGRTGARRGRGERRLRRCSSSRGPWTPQAARPWRFLGLAAVLFSVSQWLAGSFPGPEFDGFGVDDVLLFIGATAPVAPAGCWPAGSAAPAGARSSSTAR